MSVSPGERDLLALFSSLNARELNAICIASMRGLATRERPLVHPRHLGGPLVPAAAKLKDADRPADQVAQMTDKWLHCLQSRKPELLGVAGFLWWLVRAGLAVPLTTPDDWYLPSIALTDAGFQFIDSAGDHPLLPGGVKRVEDRCAGQLPIQVVDLLTDAVECLSHGLNRPAIVLLGVAYESVIEAVLESLHLRQLTGPLPAKAWQRIAALRAAIPSVFPGNTIAAKEARGAAEWACDLADKIRDRRNQASHTKQAHGFQDPDEVEEFITSGFRRLPDLWAMK